MLIEKHRLRILNQVLLLTGTGGILRVTQDGKTVGSGILGASDPLNKYFAYGVRNAFGLDFDPVTNKLWDTENGPSSSDEINLADPGFHSGWMDLMGVAPAGFNFNNLVNFGGKGIYSDPEFVWTQVVAPNWHSNFSVLVNWDSNYQNDLFVADYNKGRIYDFDLNSARTGLGSQRISNRQNCQYRLRGSTGDIR